VFVYGACVVRMRRDCVQRVCMYVWLM
jgi:hypothetical protein